MTALDTGLTLASCVFHAWWNYLFKRAKGGDTFIALTKVAEMALFAVPFLAIEHRADAALLRAWPLFTVGAGITLLNYLFLGQAYRHGDLAVAYPISRAGALVFLPILSWLLLGERPGAVGVAALLLVIAGTFLLQLKSFARAHETFRALGHPSNLHALLAALALAGYSLWDQRAVRRISPFSYFFAYTVVMGVGYSLYLLVRPRRAAAIALRKDWPSILQVAAFNTMGYILVLFALRSGRATYVIALRQLSIVLGAVLGWRLLRETATAPKRLGVAVLSVGCLLVTAAG